MKLAEQYRSALSPEDLKITLSKIALVAGQTSGTVAFLVKRGHAGEIEDEFGAQFVADLFAGSDRMLALINELIGPPDQVQENADG